MTEFKRMISGSRLSKNGGEVTKRGHTLMNVGEVQKLFHKQFQIGIGVYNGLSALLAGKWKFDFLWISSFCCSAALGLPDAGIIGPEEILDVIRCVRRSVTLPIVVDIDSGYGDAVKVFHVVEEMARAGAAALCIEDNPVSKRCSLYDGCERKLVSIDEHSARIRSAWAGVAAASSATRIIARTEALVAGLGVKEALRRAAAYVEAGADAIFVQSLDSSGEEVLMFARKWKRRTPVFIAPTRLPQITKREFANAGISHCIFANQGLRAAHAAIDRTFGTLARAESAESLGAEISSVSDVARLVGAEKLAQLETDVASKNGIAASRKSGTRPAGRLAQHG